MDQIFNDYGALLGVAALITVLINAGKRFGLIPDGEAQKWNLLGNVVGFAVFAFSSNIFPEFDWANADAIAANVVELLEVVFILMSQFGISKLLHFGAKDIPVIGFSHCSQ